MQWLQYFSSYGWIVLFPFLERIFPTRPLKTLHPGVVSDILNSFDFLVKPLFISGGVYMVQYLLPSGVRAYLSLPADLSIWIQLLVFILVSEGIFYAMHRLMHWSSFLWEFHRVHHSSVAYQSLMTARFHPVDLALFSAPYIVAISVLGFNAKLVFWFYVFQVFMDRYAHSNLNAPSFTGYFITTPHFHAWHHSTDPRAWNKNFSRDFVFLDYLFKTAFYPKGEKAQSFGEEEYPVHLHLMYVEPFKAVWRKMINANQAPVQAQVHAHAHAHAQAQAQASSSEKTPSESHT